MTSHFSRALRPLRLSRLGLLVTLSLCALLPAAWAPAEEPAPASGYLASFTQDYEAVTKKLLDLAKATPAEKFSWRPTEEVRSVSEVYIHVASANFFLSSAVGVEMPEGFSRDAEKTVTEKDAVIAMLEQSIEHVHKAVEKAGSMDLDEEIELFGGKRARRGVFLIISGHAHEHLGQSIAYARMASITPPWSQ